ncbi:MAG TPA: TetR/AcrR family transcriptional regulator [Pseudomonadales bacterium]|nr:TetR/AcrR family transcriptional regulator [Pseudomonadales bacterium]
MVRRENNRSGKRDQIIDAARKLMRARKTSGFSMRTLAEVAEVSIATPYNLFGSKEAIVAAVMDADLEDFQQALLAEGLDPLATLFRVVSLSAEIFGQEPGFYQAGASALHAETDNRLVEHFGLPRRNLLTELLTRAVQEGFLVHQVNPESLAFTLGQLFYGCIQDWARDRLSLQDMVDRTQYGFALVLAAVATEKHRKALLERAMNLQNALPESWQTKLTLAQAGH